MFLRSPLPGHGNGEKGSVLVLLHPHTAAQGSDSYLNSSTKTSLRQSIPMVQVGDPDCEPRLPIQSEEKIKNLPSCDTLPIPYNVVKICDFPVMKLCAKRHTLPLPSGASPTISLYQGPGKGVVRLQ